MNRREQNRHMTKCRCDHNNYRRNSEYRENYAVPDDITDDDDFDDLRYKASNHFGKTECSHKGWSSMDEETKQALNSFRQKAFHFIESNSDSDIESDSPVEDVSRCSCSQVMKKAKDLLDYSPESTFLKRLKKQSQNIDDDCQVHKQVLSNADDNSTCACSCKCYVKEDEVRNEKQKSHRDSSTTGQESAKGDEENFCPCLKTSKLKDNKVKEKIKLKTKMKTKSEHVSRAKKKFVPELPGKKRQCCINNESSFNMECSSSLKRPHTSCERCWKFASPVRSPVNKPHQRYDPNYRRAHAGGDSGEFDPETKVHELMTPLRSNSQVFQQRKSMSSRKSKFQGPKTGKKGQRERPRSHSPVPQPESGRCRAFNSTRYLDLPEKIVPVKNQREKSPKTDKRVKVEEKESSSCQCKSVTGSYVQSPSRRRTSSSNLQLDRRRRKCDFRPLTGPPVLLRSDATSRQPRRSRKPQIEPSKSSQMSFHHKQTICNRRRDDETLKFQDYESFDRNKRKTNRKWSKSFDFRSDDHSRKNQNDEEDDSCNPKSKNLREGLNKRKKSHECRCECHCSNQHRKFVINDRLIAEPFDSDAVETHIDESIDLPCKCKECLQKSSRNREKEKSRKDCHCQLRRNQTDLESEELENPRKYCVFYMTGKKDAKGKDVEVLVEELTRRNRRNKKDDKSSKALKDKIKNLELYRPDSMALKFQKGVADKQKIPTSPRVLYF